jgi:hypothetical protein
MHGVHTLNTPDVNQPSCQLPVLVRLTNYTSWWLTLIALTAIRYPLIGLVDLHDWLVTKHNKRVSASERKWTFCSKNEE